MGICLNSDENVGIKSWVACMSPYLDRVQHLYHSGMSQRPELAHGILRQWEPRFVRIDVECEYAAVGPVVLFH
jgi:hypothetical protein